MSYWQILLKNPEREWWCIDSTTSSWPQTRRNLTRRIKESDRCIHGNILLLTQRPWKTITNTFSRKFSGERTTSVVVKLTFFGYIANQIYMLNLIHSRVIRNLLNLSISVCRCYLATWSKTNKMIVHVAIINIQNVLTGKFREAIHKISKNVRAISHVLFSTLFTVACELWQLST